MPSIYLNPYDQYESKDRHYVVKLVSGQPPEEGDEPVPDPGKDSVDLDGREGRTQVGLLLVVDVDVQELVVPRK